MDGPDGLDHLPGAVGQQGGGGLELPDQSAVGSAQAIDKAVFTTKQYAAFPVAGWGVDAATGDESPGGLAGGGGDGVEGVFVHLRDEGQTGGGGGGAEGRGELDFPGE